MYDFQNKTINKLLIIGASILGFIIFTLILPGVVSAIFICILLWAFAGLAGWSMGRIKGEIEDEKGVPFYKEVKFYEYIARGPITLVKYLSA